MKKPAIPGSDPTRKNIDAIAQNIAILTGRSGTKITPLAANATQGDILNKINQLIDLLQG